MRKLIFLLTVPILLVSLCSSLPNIQLPFLSGIVSGTNSASPDILVSAEPVLTQISSGRSVQIVFSLENLQQYDLTGAGVTVYDHPCFPDNMLDENGITVNTQDVFKKTLTTPLKPNQTVSWTWEWYSDKSDTDRNCPIKFKVIYSAENSVSQDIVVLSRDEYARRESSGTLSSIPIQSTPSKGPWSVSPSFSEPQPFIEGQTGYDMKMNYFNTGQGFFDKMSITMVPPASMSITNDCNKASNNAEIKYTRSGNNLVYTSDSKKMEFVKGKAITNDCYFDTPFFSQTGANVISINSLRIDLDYTYILYDTFSIAVGKNNAISSPLSNPVVPSPSYAPRGTQTSSPAPSPSPMPTSSPVPSSPPTIAPNPTASPSQDDCVSQGGICQDACADGVTVDTYECNSQGLQCCRIM
jgi:hypothetical protein